MRAICAGSEGTMSSGDEVVALRAAVQGLRALIAMPGAGIATPPDISEPIVCALMRWERVTRRSAHDAEAPQGRIQIKYSTVGFVGCKATDVAKWDHLAWVHAPGRLPKVLLLIPSHVMRRAKFAGGRSFHIGQNWDVLRDNVQALRAWRLDITDPSDIERRVQAGKPRSMPARVAISTIETDLEAVAALARRKPEAKSSERPRVTAGRVMRPARRPASSRIVGRGDLTEFNGRTFKARLHGVDHTARVTDGVMWIDGVKGVGFKSLSAAGKHLTGTQTNGTTFWKPA